jgi:hypothetical protein
MQDRTMMIIKDGKDLYGIKNYWGKFDADKGRYPEYNAAVDNSVRFLLKDAEVDEYYTIGPEVDVDVTSPVNTVYTSEDIHAIKKALAMGEILTVSTYPERWNMAKIKSSAGGIDNAKFKNEAICTRVVAGFVTPTLKREAAFLKFKVVFHSPSTF